jgi:hypothetical protein
MKGCSAGFISLSALIAHAESGKCASGVTRRDTDRSVVAADINGVITKHRRIMDSTGLQMYPFEQDAKYQVNELAWNGRAYECYICHRTFRRLGDLNAHLASPAHSGAKIYHCPPRGCGKTFFLSVALCDTSKTSLAASGASASSRKLSKKTSTSFRSSGP